MEYTAVTVYTNAAGEELVANIMWELCSNGVCIYNTNDYAELLRGEVIWDYVDDSMLARSEVVRVQGFFPDEGFSLLREKLDSELQRLSAFGSFGSLEYVTDTVGEDDWLNSWKKYYQPIDMGAVAIVPSWLTYTPHDGQHIIKIEPKCAFGTGEHETTQLCLEVLGDLELANMSVLDVGTGSGILAIAAKLLSAGSVTASDIDPLAVINARENAELNGVAQDIRIVEGDLLATAEGEYDLIIANITADILISLSHGVMSHLKEGGRVLLSGIIHKRLEDVKNAFVAQGLSCVEHRQKGEWNALLLRSK